MPQVLLSLYLTSREASLSLEEDDVIPKLIGGSKRRLAKLSSEEEAVIGMPGLPEWLGTGDTKIEDGRDRDLS